jgi:predicted O-linked N-acetylglucosamine transferase (SPINDLY family)/GT2 family glycosyltransferase/lipoprotein NlpI
LIPSFPQDHVQRAWRLFDAGDLDAAIEQVRDAVAADGSSPQACAALGFFLIQSGRLDDAAAVVLPALERNPHYAPLHWYAGYLFQQRGDAAAAVAAFEVAFQLDGTLDEVAFSLAWALHDLNRIEEAAGWAEHALARARTPQRLMQVGWLRQKQGQFAVAEIAYREAIDMLDASAPEQARLHLHLSQCLGRLGREHEADAVLGQALARWPQDAELVAAAAWRQRTQGDAQGALRRARELVRAQPQLAAAWHLLGVLHQDIGELEAADAAFTEVQQLDLRMTDALLRRAQIQRKWKRYEGAQWLLGLVLQQSPDDEAAHGLLAQVLLDLGDVDGARRHLLKPLRARSRSLDLWRLLAVTQARRGRRRSAMRSLDRVLTRDTRNVEAWRLRGWVALELGERARALEAVTQLIALAPDDHAAQVQAAFVSLDAARVEQAQAWAERAVARAPDLADAWRALSQVCLHQQRLGEAEAAARQALQLAPGQHDALRQLGRVWTAAARPGHAQLALLRAIEARPDDAGARLELAEARCRAGAFAAGLTDIETLLEVRAARQPAMLMQVRLLTEGGFDGAAQACARLLRSDRHAPEAAKATLRLVGLGNDAARQLLSLVPRDVLRSALREAIGVAVHTQSQACLARLAQTAREELDEDLWVATAALYVASMSEHADEHALGLQARIWYRGLKIRSGSARLPIPAQPVIADGRPRIAYVASQLHQSLLRRVLAAHSPDRAQVFVYTNHPLGGLPRHLQLRPLVPATLAESCAANRIDIAIDAGGLHPFEGQFEVLEAYARRLAPVQLGWLGCWGSAGGLFDALLTDAAAVPVEHGPRYDERVLRLQGGQWCWEPPLSAPEVSAPPVLGRGSITYGVTARSLRLGGACLDAFARVVAATPTSTIRFVGEVAGDWPLRREILARMQAHGVAAGRVLFDPFVPHADYLQWFSRVDLILDTFPSNGGVSLLDPLWMGVPVVTLAGEWAGARQGASLLATLGLTQWVAHDEQAFCATAVAIARDMAALSEHRFGLRARILGSPLMDGRRVAAQIEDLCAQLKASTTPIAAAVDPKSRIKAHAQWALDRWLSQPRAVELPACVADPTPELSVVVVLFNQAGLSLRTLQALADQRGVQFETIVVDNASSDRTSELLARLRGARVIRNLDNVGFLRAARQGAAMARGRYIAFLNSDAILQEGALEAALQALRGDPSIGALGGRVVLTDGRLQEAGNRVFSDGSAGGIGRGEDAFGHAARAARATDYVSGVFLVTPAPLWRMLGGFDEVFAPAYYEDTDYCARVWQAGFRVVYAPAVLLEHLEWGSATGDSATLLMERNREVFCARHAAWLQHQPGPQALPLDGDRWGSPEDRPRLPRVLFVDNEVPHMVRGGGLPRARLMLQALRDWPVTLLPLWTAQDDWRAVYASLPASVEVALGCGLGGLEAFLERRRGVYEVLLVSRPDNLNSLQPLRTRRPELFAGMRLVYDAEALFALREIAMAGVQGRPLVRDAARARVEAEVALAESASDVLVVSERDANHFRAAGHRTHILSHGIALRRSAPGPAGRNGLLFVGSLHPGTPNEDGLLWFLREVMPLLRELRPAPVLSVVGLCLSDQLAAQAGPEVKLLGPQDALETHYDAARVFVAPVRFAGGVPAKVIEAAANGIPVVASALLVRQLGWRDGVDILGAREARAFARAIARLLSDDARWQRQQWAAWEQCTLRYDPEIFGETLRRVLRGVGAAPA